MANISSLNLSSVYDQLTSFANLSNFWNRFDSVFGTSYDKAIADTLRSQWQTKNFSLLPPIEVVSSRILGNARAAYGTSTNKIYISDSFLTASTTTPSAITAVLLEEIGHFVDAKVNKIDTKGDEGELFSNIVRGVTLSTSDLTRIQADNDWSKITLNRQIFSVELAVPVVYETIKVASGLSYSSIEVSGLNAIWSTSKSSNNVLNFFNGTTVAPIANSVYTNFDGYDISGSTIVYSKKGEIYRYSAGTTTKLTTNAINDYKPQIDGTNVVWYANDGTDVEIFRNNGTTTTQITNNTSDDYELQISGNYTTWVGWDGNDYEIYLNNGTTTTQVTNNTTDDYNPVISSNKLAWRGWNGTTENLFYYDGTTVTQVATNIDVAGFAISGNKVVYINGTNHSLQLYNGTAKTTTQLSVVVSDYKVDGSWVVWNEYTSSNLKLYNGTSTITLSNFSSGSSSDFLLAGNKIAYIASLSLGSNREIFLYDGTSTTQLTEGALDYNSYNHTIRSISGSNVLWSNNGDLYLSKPSTKPQLTINSLTVVEGQTSPQNAVLTVTLSAASTTPITVQYETVTNYSDQNPAYSGSDYTGTTSPVTITFAPGGPLTKTINIPILNDNESESDEIFHVKLSNPTGAVLVPGKGTGTVTISDTLQASVTTILPAGVENLTLTGSANINGTGNTNANTIRGNSGNNILDGKGITIYGSDQLIGGAGNDTYIVNGNSYQTIITENLNEGIDTVQYSPDNSVNVLFLGDNLENITALGVSDVEIQGNQFNNILTGNSGNNTLFGFGGNDILNGGGSVDQLIGDTGDDTYIVDGTTDTIYEYIGGGTDTIQSSATFSIASLTNIENLTLTGTTAINGTGNIGSNILTGNTANNSLSGDAGNDILTGAGGKDTLAGGAGIDKFSYKTLTDSLLASFDVITDFNATTGNDLFLVTTARAGFTNAGAVATLDNAGIIAKLTTTNFAANFAANFTFGTRTFVAINDATAGFSATTDAIIEVTGLTGTLATSNFVIV